MNTTPMGFRLHIAIFGKRNVGKSTLINAITNQPIAIVSDVAGTTTDPVFKTMELLPIGPIVMIDTAGLDDVGNLGALRKQKTYEVMDKTNFAIIVISAVDGLSEFEVDLAKDLHKRKIPSIGVINKSDLSNLSNETVEQFRNILDMPIAKVSSKSREDIEELKEFIMQATTAVFGSTIVTGSAVNMILIISVMIAGLSSGLTVAVISPIFAKFLGIGPLWLLIPFIVAGNIVLVLIWHFLGNRRFGKSVTVYILTLTVAAVSKFLMLYIGIVAIAIPHLMNLPEKQATTISGMFSIPQLLTALIGGVIATIIIPLLKNAVKSRQL
ncbi:GTPase [Lacrimispora brassicae]